MNILVTGGAGFIGSALVKRLKQAGHGVIVLEQPGQVSTDATTFFYDGTPESLRPVFGEKRVDCVYHLATFFTSQHNPADIPKIVNSNVTFGIYLLEAMKESSCRNIVNISTYATACPSDNAPQNLYAASKKAFEPFLELYANGFDIRALTLSLTDTYGTDDPRPKFINLALNAFKTRETFKMSPGKQTICLLYVDDVISGLIQSLHHLLSTDLRHQRFSLFGDEVLKLEDLVALISETVNVEIPLERGYYPYRKREIMDWRPLYPRLPNWAPQVPLKEGIWRVWKTLF